MKEGFDLDILKVFLDPIETFGLVERNTYGDPLNKEDWFIFIVNKEKYITIMYFEYLTESRNRKIDQIIDEHHTEQRQN
jgi:hypothetical protein